MIFTFYLQYPLAMLCWIIMGTFPIKDIFLLWNLSSSSFSLFHFISVGHCCLQTHSRRAYKVPLAFIYFCLFDLPAGLPYPELCDLGSDIWSKFRRYVIVKLSTDVIFSIISSVDFNKYLTHRQRHSRFVSLSRVRARNTHRTVVKETPVFSP